MLRAISKHKATGEDIYVVGLTAENVWRLENGEPIIFSGDDFRLPDRHFILAVIPHGKKPAPNAVVKRKLRLPKETELHALYFEPGMLTELPDGEMVLDRDLIRLPQDLLLIIADTPEALGARIGIPLRAIAPNEELRMNPLTGKMESRRTDN